jgi:hypothetical protein
MGLGAKAASQIGGLLKFGRFALGAFFFAWLERILNLAPPSRTSIDLETFLTPPRATDHLRHGVGRLLQRNAGARRLRRNQPQC